MARLANTRNARDGLNAQVAALAQQVGGAAQEQIAQIAGASGAPYQSTHLSVRDAYSRLAEWRLPSPALAPVIAKQVAQMPLARVAQAALDAVKLHRQAVKAGIVSEDLPGSGGLDAPPEGAGR